VSPSPYEVLKERGKGMLERLRLSMTLYLSLSFDGEGEEILKKGFVSLKRLMKLSKV